jgi:hypothetical protein
MELALSNSLEVTVREMAEVEVLPGQMAMAAMAVAIMLLPREVTAAAVMVVARRDYWLQVGAT